LGNLDGIASGWSRDTGWEGGPWRGSFRLDGSPEELEDWFYNGLGRHIEEISEGMVTWTGLVWEVDIVQPSKLSWLTEYPGWLIHAPAKGRRQRRTLEEVFNKVRVQYTDPSTDPATTGETAWQEDELSQDQWGAKEEILYENMDSTTALNRAQEFLDRAATAVPFMVGLEENVTDTYVEVTVVGYVATGQYSFVTTASGGKDDISDWVDAILGADIGPFLTKGVVDSNSAQIYKYLSNARRGWEVLEDLVTLRDDSGNRFQLVVTPDRVVNYRQWDREPIGYFWSGKFVTLTYDDLEVNPRLMPPGVYRASGFSGSEIPPLASGTPLLLSPNDFIVESIEVNEDDTFSIRLGVYDEEEALRSFAFHASQLPGYEAWTDPGPPDYSLL
jgi:hypothetical protein